MSPVSCVASALDNVKLHSLLSVIGEWMISMSRGTTAVFTLVGILFIILMTRVN